MGHRERIGAGRGRRMGAWPARTVRRGVSCAGPSPIHVCDGHDIALAARRATRAGCGLAGHAGSAETSSGARVRRYGDTMTHGRYNPVRGHANLVAQLRLAPDLPSAIMEVALAQGDLQLRLAPDLPSAIIGVPHTRPCAQKIRCLRSRDDVRHTERAVERDSPHGAGHSRRAMDVRSLPAYVVRKRLSAPLRRRRHLPALRGSAYGSNILAPRDFLGDLS